VDLNDRVIRNLYEAAAGVISWQDALGSLHREMSCAGVQLVTVEKSVGALVMSEQSIGAMSPNNIDGVLDHVREYHRHDPHMVHAAGLAVGEVMHSAESFPLDKWKAHKFYTEYWSAYGVHDLIAAKIAEDDRHVVMLGMTRTVEQPGFNSNDRKVLERYIGHLSSAYRIIRHLGAVQATARAGLALIQASSRPMILIDAQQNIIISNAPGKTVMTAGNSVYEHAGKLECRSHRGAAALNRGLTELSNAIESDPQRRVAVRIDGKTKEHQILCSLWALKPAKTMGLFGAVEVILITVAPAPSGSVDAVLVASMFELTPAEAKLAVALVEGLDLQKIARSHNTALETVRSQLKAIFLKTGTRRQSDLIALVLRSVAT
jgi:DNA-binding CsgD family transcriptional regulator